RGGPAPGGRGGAGTTRQPCGVHRHRQRPQGPRLGPGRCPLRHHGARRRPGRGRSTRPGLTPTFPGSFRPASGHPPPARAVHGGPPRDMATTAAPRPAHVTARAPPTSPTLGPGFATLGLALNLHNEFEVALRDDDVLTVRCEGEGAAGVPLDDNHLVV